MEINKKCAELSYKCENKKITFSELNQDMNMEEFHQHCKELAAAIGYADKSIEEWFDGDSYTYETIDNLERKISSLEAEIINLNVKLRDYYDATSGIYS